MRTKLTCNEIVTWNMKFHVSIRRCVRSISSLGNFKYPIIYLLVIIHRIIHNIPIVDTFIWQWHANCICKFGPHSGLGTLTICLGQSEAKRGVVNVPKPEWGASLWPGSIPLLSQCTKVIIDIKYTRQKR